MKERYLVTTADEFTWPKDKPILFLGEWCRLYGRRYIWQNLDAEVVPYHWDDRKKLYQDYLYLHDLYEELLNELAEQLNKIHNVDHSIRYWRILVGPWLSYFMQALFDRWEMLKKAIESYKIVEAWVPDFPIEYGIPNNMEDFENLFVSDLWNGIIYRKLLEKWKGIPIKKIPVPMTNTIRKSIHTISFQRKLKRKLAYLLSLLSGLFTRDKDVFLIITHFPIIFGLILQLQFKQIPKLWRPIPCPKFTVDLSKRKWKTEKNDFTNFKTVLRNNIPLFIPMSYLEGYKAIVSTCKKISWPKTPSLIFINNLFINDDIFKTWAAEKVEKGAPLVIGQHGGHFGIGLWEFTEEHIYKISDCFISWGWDDPERPKIIPVGNLKLIGKKINWDPEGHALMVEGTAPRYSYRMFSIPVASQWLYYFEDQFLFVKTLSVEIRKKLLVRLYSSIADYGWAEADRWKEKFPDIRLDFGETPIMPLIKKSRLYISTYNATTFLESMALNVPTVIFWNPKYFELRESSLPYFNRMKDVGIFHETPVSAAMHVIKIWNDVAGWWYSKEVQNTRDEFCERYSRVSEHTFKILKKTLQRIISNDISHENKI
ncbi:MAG: LIC12162 family protein [Syntrophorhabdaceae bacterium]|nr:LIC12162 family protein [Syntrophorhabdaceae bacterium]